MNNFTHAIPLSPIIIEVKPDQDPSPIGLWMKEG